VLCSSVKPGSAGKTSGSSVNVGCGAIGSGGFNFDESSSSVVVLSSLGVDVGPSSQEPPIGSNPSGSGSIKASNK